MLKQIYILLMVFLYPLAANAIIFDEMLVRHPSKSQPFMGEQKNVKWVSHTSDGPEEAFIGPDAEADSRGQIDEGRIDLDSDGKDETIKIIWGPGVSDNSLTIEIYKDNKLISTLGDELGGIQANYKIEDVDKEGRKEIIIWSGMWDPRLPGEDDITETTYEGHSGLHRYAVATYKLIDSSSGYQYILWDIYMTKKKYEPFCKEQPI